MFFEIATNLLTISVLGVALAWSWISFISEAIGRRNGSTNPVPYLDEVLWSIFGGLLLSLGLHGGAPVLPERLLKNRLTRKSNGRGLPGARRPLTQG